MTELDELRERTINLKKQAEEQQNIINEFKTQRDELAKEGKELNKMLLEVFSSYGMKGEKILQEVKLQTDSVKAEVEDELRTWNTQFSQLVNHVDIIESRIKNLISDTERLKLERKNTLTEMQTMEKLKDDLNELQEWKERAFERIENQENKLQDRLRELSDLEERVEEALKVFSEKVEKAFQQLKSFFEADLNKVNIKLNQLGDNQNFQTEKFRQEIQDTFNKKIVPRLSEMEVAVKQVNSMHAKFIHLQKKAEELYDGVSRFKNKFEKTEKDLNYNMQQNIRRVEDFESRVTGFMNDLIEEYEKRFEAIKKELKMVPSQIAIKDVEKTGFLNRMKNVISKPNDRIFELEVKVKEQQILLKKMLEELKDLTRAELSGEENVGEGREQ